MSAPDTVKLLPRNAAALRRGQDPGAEPRMIPGNPMSTRLESGIGNCFPGLECDLRNLERRFFPCLEVDIADQSIQSISIVSVDLGGLAAALRSGQIDKKSSAALRLIAKDLLAGKKWQIEKITGKFTVYGKLTLVISRLNLPANGQYTHPPDAWTAIRLLPEQSKLTLHARNSTRTKLLTLSGKRARYLDDHGALSAAFQPGELTQSLCSPWTHDFRDCACYYWASNHPDIAQPPLPDPLSSGPDWDRPVPWERADRTPGKLPAPATSRDPTPVELHYYEINRRWQELNFVLAGREIISEYQPSQLHARPLAWPDEVIENLKYAAGVELAVVQEYLAAAFSFKNPDDLRGSLRDSVRASKAELMRIAVGEMHHVRVVNDVLRLIQGSAKYRPALQVASKLPSLDPKHPRPLQIWPADRKTIQSFIDIESPSVSVDGLYSRILVTLNASGTVTQQHAIRTVMAEGGDHLETFRFIQEWLQPFDPRRYLRKLKIPSASDQSPAHGALQSKYKELLKYLYRGYSRGLPDGAASINQARDTMLSRAVIDDRLDQLSDAARDTTLSRAGIDDLADRISDDGFLVSFDTITDDPNFAPIPPPPA